MQFDPDRGGPEAHHGVLLLGGKPDETAPESPFLGESGDRSR